MLRMLVSTAAAVVAAAPAPATTRVALENRHVGTTSWAAARTVDADVYASELSAAPGDWLHFAANAPAGSRYRLEIYRLGWYGGSGGRLIACIPGCTTDERVGEPQPTMPPTTDDPDAEARRARWTITDSLRVGPRWLSGYYEARIVVTAGPATGVGGSTMVIVRAPAGAQSRILVQVPVNTWQAYNTWGGVSLYTTPTHARSWHVSFDRPYADLSQPMMWELPLVHFLERLGANVSYQTDRDTDDHPASLLRHRLVIVAGHDEYWTKTIRDAFEAAADAGTNLAFMGGNIGFWQIRYSDTDGVVGLDEYRAAATDPDPDPDTKTDRFRRLGRPECSLLGVEYNGGIGSVADYVVTDAGAADPWLAGTGLVAGDHVAQAVGGEWDYYDPTCAPAGTTVLFHGDATPTDADATRYTAPSGATVFSAGSLSFVQTLDDFQGRPADRRVQRFMRNVVQSLVAPRRHGR